MEHIRSASTICTELAACLCTLGIPLHPERPLEVLVGDAEQVAFYFVGSSPCGNFEAEETIKAWSDRAFLTNEPRHPIARMKTGFQNRRCLLDYSKNAVPCGIVSRGSGARLQVVHITPEHRYPPPQLRSGPAPDPATCAALRTEDIDLASALLACGIPLWTPLPITRAAGKLIFFFAPTDLTGTYQTRELMLAWQQPEWYLAHQEHSLAYLFCAFANRRQLLAEVKARVPTVCIMQRSGLPAFLSLNAPPALEKIFLAEVDI
jgi:hypothetical protein